MPGFGSSYLKPTRNRNEVPELGLFVESLNWGKSTPWLGGSFTGTRTGLDFFQKIGSSFGYFLGFKVGS
jgi:hypothetical protein